MEYVKQEKNNFTKPNSYKLLRDYTDEKNKIIEPHKPRKKKIYQLFQLKKKK
tara:strand:+ start:1746 stop:1901 length:156 start_codon:yes stop_codon:yes gene_type:complete